MAEERDSGSNVLTGEGEIRTLALLDEVELENPSLRTLENITLADCPVSIDG